jgi:hypothetical protein
VLCIFFRKYSVFEMISELSKSEINPSRKETAGLVFIVNFVDRYRPNDDNLESTL